MSGALKVVSLPTAAPAPVKQPRRTRARLAGVARIHCPEPKQRETEEEAYTRAMEAAGVTRSPLLMVLQMLVASLPKDQLNGLEGRLAMLHYGHPDDADAEAAYRIVDRVAKIVSR